MPSAKLIFTFTGGKLLFAWAYRNSWLTDVGTTFRPGGGGSTRTSGLARSWGLECAAPDDPAEPLRSAVHAGEAFWPPSG